MSHASVIIALDFNGKHVSDISIDQINEAVAMQMMPFDENGEWFKDGSRWDWYQIGGRYSGKFLGRDLIMRQDLVDEEIEKQAIEKANKLWKDWEKETRKDDFMRSYMYGLTENDTLETVIEKYKKNKISAYAFLINRRWHENGRLGWFGSNTKTECEINHGHIGTCLHKNEELDAQIISFSHNEDIWAEKYFDRFIKPLKPEIVLVNVDYHV